MPVQKTKSLMRLTFVVIFFSLTVLIIQSSEQPSNAENSQAKGGAQQAEEQPPGESSGPAEHSGKSDQAKDATATTGEESSVQGGAQQAGEQPTGESSITAEHSGKETKNQDQDKAPTATTPFNKDQQNRELLPIILGLVTAGLIASLIGNYFQFRRRANVKVPKVLKTATALSSSQDLLKPTNPEANSQKRVRIEEILTTLDTTTKGTHQQIASIFEILEIFRTNLETREAEIRRWKEGYDNAVFKKFISRFIRVDQAITEELIAHETGKRLANKTTLESLQELLLDALENCDVERFSPIIGEDFKKAFGVDENFTPIPTKNPEEIYKIAKVISPGYLLKGNEKNICIYAPKIAVFIKEN